MQRTDAAYIATFGTLLKTVSKLYYITFQSSCQVFFMVRPRSFHEKGNKFQVVKEGIL